MGESVFSEHAGAMGRGKPCRKRKPSAPKEARKWALTIRARVAPSGGSREIPYSFISLSVSVHVCPCSSVFPPGTTLRAGQQLQTVHVERAVAFVVLHAPFHQVGAACQSEMAEFLVGFVEQDRLIGSGLVLER